MKKILIFVLILTFLFLFSCGEPPETETHTECIDNDKNNICDVCDKELTADTPPTIDSCDHTDENRNGQCDLCKKEINDAIPFINNGKCNFNLVLASNIGGTNNKLIDTFINDMKKIGFNLEKLEDIAENETEYEILIGAVESRDEKYTVDVHTLGLKGYQIKIVDNKIIIIGGSNEALNQALEHFIKNVLNVEKITSKTKKLYLNPTHSIEAIQNDYNISGFKLFGEDITTFSILADLSNKDIKNIATNLQNLIYEKSGYWLSLTAENNGGNYISLNLTQKDYTEGGYSIILQKGKMEFISEYITSLESETIAYFTNLFSTTVGELDLNEEYTYNKNVRYVYYKDFGAIGDGKTDAADAIRAAHDYANRGGHEKVIAESGATYYIGRMEQTVTVKTNVDWLDAKFILDDSNISAMDEARGVDIFKVINDSDKQVYSVKHSNILDEINQAGGIDAQTCTKIDLGIDYPALIKLTNEDHMNYIRFGVNENSGYAQAEVILVDSEGNIDPSTSFAFDFEKITTAEIYRIDDPTITIEGGIFTTIANQDPRRGYDRGIFIERNNTVVQNIEHYVVGEGEIGSPYTGFIFVANANNVLIRDCILTSHKTYYTDKGVGRGSYDTGCNFAINVTWFNCTQSNFFNDDGSLVYGRWGIMSSNHSKNLTYDSCVLTRFDAHMGVRNVKIINSTLSMLRVVGVGTFHMENCHMYNKDLIMLREDYGGFWFGDFILKDITMHTTAPANIFTNTWYNHYFGFPTALPTNILIDNLKVQGSNTVNIFAKNFVNMTEGINCETITMIDPETGNPITVQNENIMTPPKKITIKNISPDLNFLVPDSSFFENVEYTYE